MPETSKEQKQSTSSRITFEDNIKTAFLSGKGHQSSKKDNVVGPKLNDNQTGLKPGQVLPIEKKPHLRSKKPLRRIPIAEIGDIDESYSSTIQKGKGKSVNRDFIIRKSSEPVRKNSDKFDKIVSEPESSNKSGPDVDSSIETEKGIPTSKTPTSPKGHKLKIEEISSIEQKQELEIGMERVTSSQDETNPDSTSVSKSKGYIKKVEEELMNPADKLVPSDQKCSNNTDISPPSSSVKFYSSWNSLTNSVDSEKLKFLNTMRAKDYPLVFKHSLEPLVFEQILQLLSRHVKENEKDIEMVAKHTYGLSKVPRVSAMVMFLSSAVKANLNELVHFVIEKSEQIKPKQKLAMQKMLL